jgi:hypothetical protein
VDISAQEALSLLRKWQEEECLLSIGIFSPSGPTSSASILGHVIAIESHFVVINASRIFPHYGENVACEIRLFGSRFAFGDDSDARRAFSQEARDHCEGMLSIHTAAGIAFCLLLLKTGV